MNRTHIQEPGMLTQCYDNRCLHPITPTDEARAAPLVAAAQVSAPGTTVAASPRDVHMSWRDGWGVLTTLGEAMARQFPTIILVCDPEMEA